MKKKKAHGHTIESSLAHLRYGETNFNLIDTPGYTDFIGGMIGSLVAVDSAIICINAHDGIQLGARRAMTESENSGIGRMIVVTKMDDPAADYSAILEECRELWGPSVVPIQVPLGQGDALSGVASTIDLPGEARAQS